jgi:hypothetical protein
MVWDSFLCCCVSIRNHVFTGGIAEVIEHLPSKHTARSSNPILPKYKNKKPQKCFLYSYHRSYIKYIMAIQQLDLVEYKDNLFPSHCTFEIIMVTLYLSLFFVFIKK